MHGKANIAIYSEGYNFANNDPILERHTLIDSNPKNNIFFV